jgi:hypothetical protein
MATGFTVHSGELASGSGKVTKQGQECAEVGSAVVGAIAGMAGAAGDSPLADTLVGASETGTQTFLITGELYSYVAGGLSESAANYRNAEQANITSIGGLW